MAKNIYEAFIKGPSDEKQAKLILVIASTLVGFSVITTICLYAYSALWGIEGSLGELLNDHTIPLTVLVLIVCGYFTYKGSVIAASILLVNQLLDALVLVMEEDSSISAITIIKIVIYISAIRAAWFIRKLKSKPKGADGA